MTTVNDFISEDGFLATKKEHPKPHRTSRIARNRSQKHPVSALGPSKTRSLDSIDYIKTSIGLYIVSLSTESGADAAHAKWIAIGQPVRETNGASDAAFLALVTFCLAFQLPF